jgi:hypothetical protein
MLNRILWVLLFAMVGVVYKADAQQQTDSAKLQGNWVLTGVQSELLSQSDDKLLERSTLDPSSVTQWRTMVPMKADFREDSCLLHGRASSFQKYTIERKGLLLVSQKLSANLPAMLTAYHFDISASGVLTITLPAAYYQDAATKSAVKIVYQCQYKRS